MQQFSPKWQEQERTAITCLIMVVNRFKSFQIILHKLHKQKKSNSDNLFLIDLNFKIFKHFLKALLYSKTDMFIKVIGIKIKGVEKESRFGRMDRYMKDTGKII